MVPHMTNNSGNGPMQPGFYPDNQGTMRWWDGSTFTERTQSSGVSAPPPPPAQTKSPWYKKKLVWAIAAIVIIAVAAASGGGSSDDKKDEVAADTSTSEPSEPATSNTKAAEPKETPKPAETKPPEPEPEPEVDSVKAADMLKDFEDNELSADAKYKGKTLKISGIVNSIDTDFFNEDKYILMIGGGGDYEFLTVNCNDMSTDELSTLKTGEKVTVIGEFDDGGDLGVEIADCKLA